MAPRLRSLLQHTLELVTFIIVFGSIAESEPIRKRFGELVLSIDSKHWRIERPAQHTLNVVPIGALAKTRRPIVVTQSASHDLRGCEVLARTQLPESLYGVIEARAIEVGGLQAVSVQAHTRCRNATPTGVAICIPHRGIGYVLTDRISGCRSAGGSAFSGGNSLEELTTGVQFGP